MRSGRAAQVALGIAAWGWIAAVVFFPAVVFPIGSFICHQRPERSFFFHGRQFAVCARCTGIYAGAALAAPLAALTDLAALSRGARAVLMLAALPTLVTWAVEFVGLMPFSNLTRFVAGVPLGIAAAWLVFAELNPRPAPAPRGPQPA